jgi:Na+/H+ antiporter NhaC
MTGDLAGASADSSTAAEGDARGSQQPDADRGGQIMLSYWWAWIPAIFIAGTIVLVIPYFGLLFLLFLLASPFLLIWGGEFLTHDPAEEIRRTKRHKFLGRGGPDDPFAGDPYDE